MHVSRFFFIYCFIMNETNKGIYIYLYKFSFFYYLLTIFINSQLQTVNYLAQVHSLYTILKTFFFFIFI